MITLKALTMKSKFKFDNKFLIRTEANIIPKFFHDQPGVYSNLNTVWMFVFRCEYLSSRPPFTRDVCFMKNQR